jgi:hypothetical protein
MLLDRQVATWWARAVRGGDLHVVKQVTTTGTRMFTIGMN